MPQETQHKKRKYWLIGLIVLVLVVGGFINYRYIQNATREQYLQGGSDAIKEIIDTAKISGGVTLETSDNETIILAQYNKAIEPPKVAATNYTVPQTTTPPVANTTIPPLTTNTTTNSSDTNSSS